MNELKPCPFCGGIPEVTKHFKHEIFWLVHRCRVMPTIVMDFAEPGYNEAKWNTRTDSLAPELVEVLERIEQKFTEHSEAWIHDVADDLGSGPHDEDCRACEYTQLLTDIRNLLQRARGTK